MEEIELEKTFLVKRIPVEIINNSLGQHLLDIYFPVDAMHPILRLRKKGDNLNLTKKRMISETDASEFIEETIVLSEPEYKAFLGIPGKRVHKMRYTNSFNGVRLDLDVFLEDLVGLVLADFEFQNMEAKEKFLAPDWCLCDVTQEEFIAGGYLAGKSYQEIEKKLQKFGYEKKWDKKTGPLGQFDFYAW